MEPTPQTGAAIAASAVSGLVAFIDHAVLVAKAARMDIAIFSDTLDRRIYGDDRFVATVRAFVLQNRRARLRVLVRQPVQAMRGAHRLVELGRMLSSRIEFRQPPEDRRLPSDEYLLADERALLIRDSPGELEARYYASAPLEARQQLRSFSHLWEESVPAREFTDLKL